MPPLDNRPQNPSIANKDQGVGVAPPPVNEGGSLKLNDLKQQLIKLYNEQDNMDGNGEGYMKRVMEIRDRILNIQAQIELAKTIEFEAVYANSIPIPENYPKDYEGIKSKIEIAFNNKKSHPHEGGYPSREYVIIDARSVMQSAMSNEQKKELLDMIKASVASSVLGEDASKLIDLYISRVKEV